MKNKTYDILKRIALVILPATGAAYFATAEIWSLPYAAQVVGTITVIETFLGAVLGFSSKAYNQQVSVAGKIVIDTQDPEKDLYTLLIDRPVSELSPGQEVIFKVTGDSQDSQGV